MDISIANRAIGRVTIELYENQCPRTCENFRQLCTGDYRPRGVPIGYRDTPIHRIIPGIIVQGGDCVNRDGTGCISIYGHTFEDEESALSFDEPGVVSMANSGPDSNGCQFFITLSPVKSLEGRSVAFGKVIDGIFVLRQVESVPLKPNTEEPSLSVVITQCGEL